MYRIRRSVDVDFAHHVRGHQGPCANIHGHTWKLELELRAASLDGDGFVVDFHALDGGVLEPCRALLDHALAVGDATFAESGAALAALGAGLVPSPGSRPPLRLAGARAEYPGGMKVVVFPFSPTSERLARWLFDLAEARLADGRVQVHAARVYETLHPVESVGEYHRDD